MSHRAPVATHGEPSNELGAPANNTLPPTASPNISVLLVPSRTSVSRNAIPVAKHTPVLAAVEVPISGNGGVVAARDQGLSGAPLYSCQSVGRPGVKSLPGTPRVTVSRGIWMVSGEGPAGQRSTLSRPSAP